MSPTTCCPRCIPMTPTPRYPRCLPMVPTTCCPQCVYVCHPLSRTDEKRILFPVLARMEFDTKERTKFFCLARQRACAIGSGPRQAHSVLRHCTPHVSRPSTLEQLISAVDPDCVNCDTARASISRRGLHPTWRVTALSQCQYSVIKWPGRLYFGLFAYDIMHGLFLNCVGYLIDALLDILTPTKKCLLDRRVESFTSFRNPRGETTRRVTKLSSTAYLTAEMMVVHLFIWTHALGSKALLLPAEVRHDALIALSSLQTICYSVRGRRPYTANEHSFIFENIGKEFFRALSNLADYKRQKQIREAQLYNVDKPPAKRRRVPHWKHAKYLEEETTTASSSDSDVPPYFLRSEKIIPHSFKHFPEQVRMGGTHRFHDTVANEAAHRKCLGKAGARARTYHDSSRSCDGMLNFLNDVRMLEEICLQANVEVDHDAADHGIHSVYP